MVDAFIIVFLLFLWCWDYPADHPAKRLISLFSFPFVYLGLWHGWSMFAPEPIHVCRWLKAVIRFSDGTIEEWEPLRPVAERRVVNTLLMRSFKFQHSVVCGKNRQLYLPLCQFLAQYAADEHRKVVSVELFREFRKVNAPGAPTIYSEAQSISFFQYSASRSAENPQINSDPTGSLRRKSTRSVA